MDGGEAHLVAEHGPNDRRGSADATFRYIYRVYARPQPT